MIHANTQDNIQRETLKIYGKLCKKEADQRKQCLRWALAGMLAANEWGFRTCINAGSASWKLNDLPAPMSTHFSYHWQGLSRRTIDKLFLNRGVLPEIHCWVAFPDEGVIYDPTTKFIEDLAKDHGIMHKHKLPEWTWVTADDMPDGWLYRPEMDACELAHELAKEIMDESCATA